MIGNNKGRTERIQMLHLRHRVIIKKEHKRVPELQFQASCSSDGLRSPLC